MKPTVTIVRFARKEDECAAVVATLDKNGERHVVQYWRDRGDGHVDWHGEEHGSREFVMWAFETWRNPDIDPDVQLTKMGVPSNE